MILNLAAAFLAASSINGQAANQALEFINQANASEICVQHAIDEGYASPNLDQNAVTDLSGNIFLVETGEQEGFMIVDPISQLYIESTPGRSRLTTSPRHVAITTSAHGIITMGWAGSSSIA